MPGAKRIFQPLLELQYRTLTSSSEPEPIGLRCGTGWRKVPDSTALDAEQAGARCRTALRTTSALTDSAPQRLLTRPETVCFEHSIFRFQYCFEFRASDFVFSLLIILCLSALCGESMFLCNLGVLRREATNTGNYPPSVPADSSISSNRPVRSSAGSLNRVRTSR